MTELAKQLLSALEQLQQDYSQRLDEWKSAFAVWRRMSGLMQRESAMLSVFVSGLSRQVERLYPLLRQLQGCRRDTPRPLRRPVCPRLRPA
ncbi:MbeD family mobilization/exclusion protein, partial [Enterobacter hormaechei]|nr:MbeD family mobilization/exclusion protein [Enterobacter hormaechei]